MKFIAVFTATRPDQYKNVSFCGGSGTAIKPTVRMVELEITSENLPAQLQHELNRSALDLSREYDHHWVIALATVLPSPEVTIPAQPGTQSDGKKPAYRIEEVQRSLLQVLRHKDGRTEFLHKDGTWHNSPRNAVGNYHGYFANQSEVKDALAGAGNRERLAALDADTLEINKE